MLRLKDDGTIPSDNPFVGKAGARGEIYTIGHRDHHGIAVNPASGQVFQAYPGNGPALSGWLPLDKVSVCKIGGTGVQITNLSKNGASVNALYLPGQRGPF